MPDIFRVAPRPRNRARRGTPQPPPPRYVLSSGQCIEDRKALLSMPWPSAEIELLRKKLFFVLFPPWHKRILLSLSLFNFFFLRLSSLHTASLVLSDFSFSSAAAPLRAPLSRVCRLSNGLKPPEPTTRFGVPLPPPLASDPLGGDCATKERERERERTRGGGWEMRRAKRNQSSDGEPALSLLFSPLFSLRWQKQRP